MWSYNSILLSCELKKQIDRSNMNFLCAALVSALWYKIFFFSTIIGVSLLALLVGEPYPGIGGIENKLNFHHFPFGKSTACLS